MFDIQERNQGNVGAGALLAFVLYVMQARLILLFANSPSVGRNAFFLIVAFVPPITQFLYVVPLYAQRKSKGRLSTSTGLLTGAVMMGLIHLAIFGSIELFH